MSEVENTNSDVYKTVQLGPKSVQIPYDWLVKKIAEISEVNYGKSLPDSEGKIPAVGSSGIYRHIGESLIEKDTIVVGRKGSAGEAYLLQEPCWPSDTAFYLSDFNTDEMDMQYLYYYMTLNSLVEELEQTTIPSLDRTRLETYQILTPPLPEQRRIADILSTVDEQIQQTEEAIKKTRELKQGVVQDLIFYGPDHQDTQTVQLGPATTEIAASWDVSSVGEVATRVQYGSSESLSQEGEYPVFRMNNIEDGKMVASPMKYSELSPEQAEKYRVEKGDILFNRTNSIELVGKCGIFDLDGEFVFASYLIRIQTGAEMNPYFLNYYLNSHIGQDMLEAYATRGASQANINATSLKNVNVPLPPRDVQDKIVTQIQTIEKKIEEEQETKAELKNLKRGLMQDLLTGTKRVDA